MLKIKTYVDKSKIHGLGVFSSEFVPAGTIIWQYNPLFTVKIKKEDIAKYSEEELSHLDEGEYYWIDKEGNYMFPMDNDRFMNHSSNPNVVEGGDMLSVAARDIEPGDELTADYRTIVPSELWEDYYLR